MDEWFDILHHVSYRKVVWFSQCSQLFQAISESHLQHVQWKRNELKGCAWNGDLKGAKYLVERCGADVHADDEKALREASESGHLKVVRYLVEKGADVHADGEDALIWAGANGALKVVRFLVEEGGADVHVMGDCPLRKASFFGQLEVIRYLVERCGADVHALNDLALRVASDRKHLKVVKYLKSKGAVLRR